MLMIFELLKPYYIIAQKTKNLANHKISKALVSDGVPIGDLAGARTQDPLLKREMLYH